MREASDRFRSALGKATRWVTVVEYTNDGSTWSAVALVDGSVSRSLDQTTHWQASLTLSGVEASVDGINPYTTRVRIRHGIVFSPGDFELLNFGLFRVTSAEYDETAQTLAVEMASYEDFVISGTLTKAKTYKAGSADSVIRQVLSEVFPEGISLAWDPRIADKRNTAMPAQLVDQDRWSVIDGGSAASSVAAAISGRVIADPDGGFVVLPVSTLEDDSVFSVSRGDLLVSRSRSWDREGVANIVIVSGESVDGVTIGPAVVQDLNPESSTNVIRPISEGGFGPVPYYYTSSLITTDAQALNVAKSKLAERLGLKLTVSFGSTHNPLLEPGDVIDVDGEKVILDSITYSLKGEDLSADTRTQSSNLAGDVSDQPSEADDDDQGDGDAS